MFHLTLTLLSYHPVEPGLELGPGGAQIGVTGLV